MTGRGDPPEGTPDGVPGGEDEYRSVVFDESFVRAARIQEFSATERMGTAARAVRTRRLRGSVSRQAFALILLIALAFGTAVYMGIRHPYQDPDPLPAPELSITLVPLAPPAPRARQVPRGGEDRPHVTLAEPATPGAAEPLFDASPAEHYRTGAEGIALPAARRTAHFSEGQVLEALTAAKDYLLTSSVHPDVLVGGATRDVRQLLDPAQVSQFDRSLDRPADDGRHAATGWMVRFDPEKVALADTHVRVKGTIDVTEASPESLQVTTDHTFVYAVQAAPEAAKGRKAEAALFTVRRELHMRFDREGLRNVQVTLLDSAAEAGPQPCSADGAKFFQPVLPGPGGTARDADRGNQGAGTDPYNRDRPVAAVCGVLATGS